VTTYDRLNLVFQRYYDRLFNLEGLVLVLGGVAVGIFSLDVAASQRYVFWSLLLGLGSVPFVVNRLRRAPRLSIRRVVGGRVVAGSTVAYRLLVTNEGSRPLYDAFVRDEGLPFGVRPRLYMRQGEQVPVLPPGTPTVVRLQSLFERRGRVHMPAVRAEFIDDFGLTRWGRTYPAPSSVTVVPRMFPVASFDLSRVRVHQPGGVPLAASVGESPEFLGLRAYRHGDPVRHISWKAFARLGTPIIREFQGEYFRRVAVVLDTRTDGTAADVEDFEGAVSLVASVARYFEDHEYIIDLFAAGPQLYYLCTGMAIGHVEAMLDVLACVEPTTTESFPMVDEGLRSLVDRLSAVVLVTTDWRSDSREFHQRLVGEVPEVKVLVVRTGSPTFDPAADVEDWRLLRVLDPRALEEGALDL